MKILQDKKTIIILEKEPIEEFDKIGKFLESVENSKEWKVICMGGDTPEDYTEFDEENCESIDATQKQQPNLIQDFNGLENDAIKEFISEVYDEIIANKETADRTPKLEGHFEFVQLAMANKETEDSINSVFSFNPETNTASLMRLFLPSGEEVPYFIGDTIRGFRQYKDKDDLIEAIIETADFHRGLGFMVYAVLSLNGIDRNLPMDKKTKDGVPYAEF